MTAPPDDQLAVDEAADPSSFAVATAVAAVTHDVGATGWTATIPAGWNVPIGVHGGMLLAVALRAAQAERDAAGHRDQVLRSAHASFLARPDDGRLVLHTEILRTGGTTSHVDVTARHPGGDVDLLSVRALYTRPRPPGDGTDFLDVEMPDVPPPAACPTDRFWGDDAGPLTRPPLFAHFDFRPALGALPWEPGWQPGAPARYARWGRLLEPVSDEAGHLDPLALLPMADLPGPSLWTRFGPGEQLRALTSLELTFHLLEPARDEWVLADFRTRWFGDGYAHTTCDLWSADRLVAVSEQMMLVRPLPV